MLFSNYVEKGQAISIKEKTESPFLDNTMEKILNQIKYEEKYKKYENLDKKSLYWKVMMIGGAFSGNIAQNSVYNYLHYYKPSTINEENYNHFDILFKGKRLEVKFSSQLIFRGIKPNLFNYILFVGIDENDSFYFEIMSRDEVNEYIRKHNLSYQTKEGYTIHVHDISFFRFGNHLTYSDIENYIK